MYAGFFSTTAREGMIKDVISLFYYSASVNKLSIINISYDQLEQESALFASLHLRLVLYVVPGRFKVSKFRTGNRRFSENAFSVVKSLPRRAHRANSTCVTTTSKSCSRQ